MSWIAAFAARTETTAFGIKTSATRFLWPSAGAWITTALVVVATATAAHAQLLRKPAPTSAELAALGLQEKSLKVGAAERWFLVQPPADSGKAAPVLLVLHGGTQSMRRLFDTGVGATRGWPDLAKRENAVLLVPNGVNPDTGDAKSDDQNWNDLRQDGSRMSNADDVGFVLALLDWAQKTYKTDPARVYVTGASNGGIMTFRLLMEAPERFAAGAAIVAALPVDSRRIKVPAKPTPLMLANGTLDPLMLWNGGEIFGNRGKTRSVADTVAWWVAANKAAPEPSEVTQLTSRNKSQQPGDCVIERRVYAASPAGAPVVAYSLQGGGHNLPSAKYAIPDSWLVRRFIGPVCHEVEGTELIWQFLSAHRR